MIVRIFSTNRIFIIAFIPLVLILLRFSTFIQPFDVSTEGMLPWCSDIFRFLEHQAVLSHLLSAILITIQAYFLARISDDERLFERTSNLPAFVLALSYSALPEFHVLSPALVANVFLVLALRRILQIYNQASVRALVFRAGFYIGLASLFYKPSAAMYILLVYQLNTFRTFNWREMVIPLLALLVPLFYLSSWYYLTGEMNVFRDWMFTHVAFLTFSDFQFWSWPAFALFLFLTGMAFFHLLSTGSRRTIRLNNLYKVLSASALIFLLMLLTRPPDVYSVFLLTLPSLCVIQSNYILGIRRNWLRELLAYALVLSIIGREILRLI